MDALTAMLNWIFWIPCADGHCVKVEKTDGGVRLTSTVDGNDGSVEYTGQEWANFVNAVKAGEADHTLA